MPEQELSQDAKEQAKQRPRRQALKTVVSTTTHGKLRAEDAELLPGWVRVSAPIQALDTQGEGTLLEVESLALPSEAVRQVVREK